MSILSGKRIILGVSGSIAAYKATDLASKLTQAGTQVDVILTSAAEKFITPLTFQSVTGRRAYTDADLWGNQAHVLHVGLGHNADLIVVAPCTANTLAKLAHGQADSLLTVTALASTCPLVIAPAMDGGMYDHPATQENLDTCEVLFELWDPTRDALSIFSISPTKSVFENGFFDHDDQKTERSIC